jgi:hypothetical protein
VLKVSRAQKGNKAQLVLRASVVPRVKMAHKAQLALKAYRAQKEFRAQQVKEAMRVLEVILEHQGMMVLTGLKAQLAKMAPREPWVHVDMMALKEKSARQAQLALMELQGKLE